MDKKNFYIVYIEDIKTGKRIDCGDIFNNRLLWTFYDEDYALDFASLLCSFLYDRYVPCVVECSSDDCKLCHVYVP